MAASWVVAMVVSIGLAATPSLSTTTAMLLRSSMRMLRLAGKASPPPLDAQLGTSGKLRWAGFPVAAILKLYWQQATHARNARGARMSRAAQGARTPRALEMTLQWRGLEGTPRKAPLLYFALNKPFKWLSRNVQ